MSSVSRPLEGLAFIFDLDGVIVDSNPVHVEVWRAYLRRHEIDPGDSLPARMYGRRNDEIVNDFFGGRLASDKVAAHGAAKEALYRRTIRPQLQHRLVPGVAAFLKRHRGMPMGVATNAEPANAEFILKEAGLREYFSVVVDGHQVERPKPGPDIYLRAANLLGTAASNCIVFEDSLAGLEAGRSAGARLVALRTTHAAFPQADLVIDDFTSPALDLWLSRQEARL